MNWGICMYSNREKALSISIVFFMVISGNAIVGNWTNEMESHFRLHTGAVHLLAAHMEENDDGLVRKSLAAACAFTAQQTDTLKSGVWLLHDSLERSEDTLRQYPFRWVASQALGKAPSNLLILNTHVDSTIALERARRVTNQRRHAPLIASANRCTRAVLGLRTAEWLYRPLFRLLGLTLLPTQAAQNLPLPIRAFRFCASVSVPAAISASRSAAVYCALVFLPSALSPGVTGSTCNTSFIAGPRPRLKNCWSIVSNIQPIVAMMSTHH